MTDDDFKRIWAEHGNPSCGPWWDDRMPAFRAIAAAARAEEREGCAAMLDAAMESEAEMGDDHAACLLIRLAKSIRSRSAAGEQGRGGGE